MADPNAETRCPHCRVITDMSAWNAEMRRQGEESVTTRIRNEYGTYLAAASGALAISDPDTASKLRELRLSLKNEGRPEGRPASARPDIESEVPASVLEAPDAR